MPGSKEAVIVVVITFLSVVLIFNHSFSVLALPPNTNPISCHIISNSASASHPNGITECCQRVGTYVTFGSWCTKCDNTNPPSNCGPRYCGEGNCNPYSIGPVGNSKSTPPPPPNALQSPSQQQQTTKTCPNGLAPDANSNCPTSTTNQSPPPPSPQSLSNGNVTNNNNPTSSSSHHHKGIGLGQTGGERSLTSKKTNNNDNSPTPPACPTDNSPIPPNCTLKPKF
jgi:hypothetical protein